MTLSCVLWSDASCPYRTSPYLTLFEKCFSCSHYEKFLDVMSKQDEKDEGLVRVAGHLTVRKVRAQYRAFAKRLRLNSQLTKKKYWYLPVDNVGHINYMPVGRAVEKTNDFCGGFRGLGYCEDVGAHHGKTYKNEDCTNKAVAVLQHYWCKKSACPVCFISGWSIFEANRVSDRLNTAVKRGLGKIEHITVSVPEADYGLEESALRIKCRNALLDRGVEGGCMIFHGFRIVRTEDFEFLAWRPHYHCVGVVRGGFDRCRNCKLGYEFCVSSQCDGLKSREVHGYKWDNYIVKVHDERQTVFGTIWYQLNHSTVRLEIKRFCAVTWFGSMANSRFKSERSNVKCGCPICNGDLKKGVYVGQGEKIVKDLGSPAYRKVVLRDAVDSDGEPNFISRGEKVE